MAKQGYSRIDGPYLHDHVRDQIRFSDKYACLRVAVSWAQNRATLSICTF